MFAYMYMLILMFDKPINQTTRKDILDFKEVCAFKGFILQSFHMFLNSRDSPHVSVLTMR